MPALICSRSVPCCTRWRPGRYRSDGESTGVIFEAILDRAPVPPVRLNPDLPAELERIITKCLEKDRNLRYQHASDIRTDLQRLKRDTESRECQQRQRLKPLLTYESLEGRASRSASSRSCLSVGGYLLPSSRRPSSPTGTPSFSPILPTARVMRCLTTR